MAGQHHGAWAEYAREQRAVRLRETRGRADVTGQEALDRIIDAIGEGRTLGPGEAQRARASSERRERNNDAIRSRHAPGYESALRARQPCTERLALAVVVVGRLPERTARVVALAVQGVEGGEIARRTGLSEDAVRQCLSRTARRLSA